MIDIKETSRELLHGHTVVGTTPVQLSDNSFTVMRGILLRAPGTSDPVPNTAIVWIGRSAVTANSNVGTGGIPLTPGQTLFIPIEEAALLYCVSTAADQDIAWMAL